MMAPGAVLGTGCCLIIRRRSKSYEEAGVLPIGVIFLGFVLAATIKVYESDALLPGLTPTARAILILPLFGSMLAVITLILTCAAWMGWGTPRKRPYWDLPGRVHYTLLAVTGVAFIWWLSAWNLLGFRF